MPASPHTNIGHEKNGPCSVMSLIISFLGPFSMHLLSMSCSITARAIYMAIYMASHQADVND